MIKCTVIRGKTANSNSEYLINDCVVYEGMVNECLSDFFCIGNSNSFMKISKAHCISYEHVC